MTTYDYLHEVYRVRNLAAPSYSPILTSGTEQQPTSFWGGNQNKKTREEMQQYRPETVSTIIDYRNFKFAELENYQTMTFDRYAGPTPESNWVLPNKVIQH